MDLFIIIVDAFSFRNTQIYCFIERRWTIILVALLTNIVS